MRKLGVFAKSDQGPDREKRRNCPPKRRQVGRFGAIHEGETRKRKEGEKVNKTLNWPL